MKLRNKKTGEMGNARLGNREIYVDTDDKTYCYVKDVDKFCKEWECAKPAEPLIKDEKIRKAVRAWAEANEVVKAFVVLNEHMNWTIHGDDIDRNRFRIEFFDRVVSENDETKNYTIAELCGEEK